MKQINGWIAEGGEKEDDEAVEKEEGVAEDYTALKQGFLKLLEKAAAAVAGSHKSTPAPTRPAGELCGPRVHLSSHASRHSCPAPIGFDYRCAQPAG